MADDRHTIRPIQRPEIILLTDIRDAMSEQLEISKAILQELIELRRDLDKSTPSE